MTAEEHLIPTIDACRQALKKWEGERINLIPRCPGWVPEHWKVRNLNSSEVKELAVSLKLTILEE